MDSLIPLDKAFPDSFIHNSSLLQPTPLAPDGRPFPPADLAYRVGGTGYEGFFRIGAGVKQRILQALPQGFSFEGKRIYEFGCGSGRVLRHFYPEAETCEFWGSDIDYPSIAWLTENLSPPFFVFQNTEHPTLPLDSNSFDLIFTISVFSHIHVNWSQWMMELRRILKPGGLCFTSFLGPNIFEKFTLRPYVENEYGLFAKDLHQDWDKGGPTVFLSPDWIKTYWGSLFEIDLIALGGLMDFQSIVMMHKPAESGKPLKRSDAPVVQMGVTHAINPNASGHIEAAYPPESRLADAYGIRGHGKVPLRGWVAFKGDRPVKTEVTIAGREAATLFASDLERKEDSVFPETPSFLFNYSLDIEGLKAGRHDLRMNFLSLNGESHWLSIPLIVEEQ